MTRYPQKKSEERFLSVSNVVLTVFFLGENLVVCVGGGVRNFFREKYNVFDSLISLVSRPDSPDFAEILIEGLLGSQIFTGSEVLYTFRIFRIVKLINIAGQWKGFRVQLKTTWMALKDMGDFLILLLAYLTISSLLSTELFAYNVLFSKRDKLPLNRTLR